MSRIEEEVRAGIAGAWDRFVGPGQSRTELLGTLAASAAGALWGHRALASEAPRHVQVVMRVAAVDLWGGTWVNNTPSCVRWYERPGQGPADHAGFAALHLLHAAVVGYADTATGSRDPGSASRWALAHWGWMLVSTVGVAAAPRRARLPLALGASAAGLGLDRALGRSSAAPWFAPVFYAKLLIGHAAGSIWNRG